MQTVHAARIDEDLALPDELREQVRQLEEVTGGAVNVSLTMLHHPALTQRYSAFGGSFLTDGILPERDRELVILRVAWICDSQYEWAQHTRISLTCGITAQEILRITTGELSEWDGQDAELLAAVDSVVRDHSLSPQQWARLSERYGTKGAIETVMLAGNYVMLAGLLNSAGTQIEPGNEAVVPLRNGGHHV